MSLKHTSLAQIKYTVIYVDEYQPREDIKCQEITWKLVRMYVSYLQYYSNSMFLLSHSHLSTLSVAH